MVNRKLSLILILLVIMLLSVTSISYASSPTVILDGEELYFDVQPVIENGRTLVPFRGIFEALGADVSWDPLDQSITAIKSDGTELTLWTGSRAVLLDWDTFTIDEPPKIINGRTLVPLRVVSEAFGANVDWNGYSQTITISSNNIENIPITINDFAIGDIKLYMSRSQVYQALGPPQNVMYKLGMEEYLRLKYPGLEIDTKNYEDDTSVCLIEITSPNYVTVRGLKVGDNISKVIEKYGEPLRKDNNSLSYVDLTSMDIDTSNGVRHYPRGINIELNNNIVTKVKFYDLGW